MLGDLKPFMGYIEDELNVASIEIESKVEKYISLTCLPNLPVMGPKFKGNKAFGEINKGIKALTNEQIKAAKIKG